MDVFILGRMLIDPERREIAAILARLPHVPRCRVVEIGCGDGRLTRRYSAAVGSVLAIDPDERAIAAFREGGVDDNVEVHHRSVAELTLADSTVDVVLFSWSL